MVDCHEQRGRSESDWLREMKRTAPNKMETIDQIIAYIAHCGYNTLARRAR